MTQPSPYAQQPYPAAYHAQQRRPANTFGCWLTALVTVFVAGMLALVGLFLPPFNAYERLFAQPLNDLSSAGASISSSDGSLRLTTVTQDGGFFARVDSIPLASFAAQDADAADWIPQLSAELPAYLALQSPIYDIGQRGSAPQRSTLEIAAPLNSLVQPGSLDMYGWYTPQTPGDPMAGWQFIPSKHDAQTATYQADVGAVPQRVALFQSVPVQPTISNTHSVTQTLTQQVANVLDIAAPGGLQPTADGRVVGHLAPGFELGAPYAVMPSIHDYADPRALDTETANLILSNASTRLNHAQAIAQLIGNGGFAGVFIDYRGVGIEQRDSFSQFLADLKANMNASGALLGVVLPMPGYDAASDTWTTGAYDWQAIGHHADLVTVNLPLDPQAYAPNASVQQMLSWAVRNVQRQKLMLGLSGQSVRVVGGDVNRIGYDAALAGLGDVAYDTALSDVGTIEPGSEIRARLDGMAAASGVDTTLNAPYLTYLSDDGNPIAQMWLGTGDALRYRMDWVTRFALAGVMYDDLLSGDLADDALSAVQQFDQQLSRAPAPVELALRWRIEGADGLVDEVTTGINDQLVVTLAAPDGNYAFNVAVVGVGQQIDDDNTQMLESARSGAAVALFQATPTPTPLPTETPTPTPTQTPTPRPIQATAAAPAGGGGAAPSGANFAAAPPPSGSIGNFEYGGHVSNPGSAQTVAAMRQAGMTWLKIQKRFYRGSDNVHEVADSINVARQNGFKVLIGTVGDPNQLGAGGQGYISDYTNWLSRIAALGPDAIEVWNEPNLDREWPRGQISGAAYADMLRQGYNAIKNTNGSVMVISAAPAPTGAENAFPGQVVNDDRWLTDMVNAGGLNYADCIGIHYNEGIVPPSVTNGDPRDNFYSRYYWTLTNLYWGIIGGQRPLCYTELGYLSSQGFPPLPGGFAWASNVTVEQQAAWLAQAAALSAQSGKVRMMIVWNVDFQGYGTDPQAGYAMIRPGGDCPACRTLAAAR